MVPVKKQLGYIFSSTKHVTNMNTRMKQQDVASLDVKNHMEANNKSYLEIPVRVPDWLEDVEKIKKDAESISITSNGCFNMKMRYRAGRNAFKITEEMGSLIGKHSKIIWSDAQKPLGKVNSKIASNSSPLNGDAQNHFKSREKSFKKGFESLQQDHISKVIALCGMGGVGKTTMMEQLKKAAEDIEISYNYIKVEEEKTNFLMCGLYIPIEELTRYAWGLELLSEVSTLGDARDRTKTCVQNLKSANLLLTVITLGVSKCMILCLLLCWVEFLNLTMHG